MPPPRGAGKVSIYSARYLGNPTWAVNLKRLCSEGSHRDKQSVRSTQGSDPSTKARGIFANRQEPMHSPFSLSAVRPRGMRLQLLRSTREYYRHLVSGLNLIICTQYSQAHDERSVEMNTRDTMIDLLIQGVAVRPAAHKRYGNVHRWLRQVRAPDRAVPRRFLTIWS